MMTLTRAFTHQIGGLDVKPRFKESVVKNAKAAANPDATTAFSGSSERPATPRPVSVVTRPIPAMIEASTTAFAQSNDPFGLTVPLAEGIIKNTTFCYITFPEPRYICLNIT
jgi:hypothetical protein